MEFFLFLSMLNFVQQKCIVLYMCICSKSCVLLLVNLLKFVARYGKDNLFQ